MTQMLTATELRALILQQPAYLNAQAILADDWGGRTTANPLYQAPISIADLRFVRDLQVSGVSPVVLDFTDYGAVQTWISQHQTYLTPNVISWLRRPFE